jgi:hypothetical protein
MVGAAALDLSVGAGIVLAGVQWTVVAFEPQYGHVLLGRLDGEQHQTTVRALLHHPDRRQSAGPEGLPAASRGRQPAVLSDLTEQQQERLRLRVAHLLEAETGFRSGDPLRPAPGEPRAAYDPATTTLGARRQAKVAELGALDGEAARLLGLERVSQRTLERLAAAYRRFGIAGVIDGRTVRRRIGHVSVGEQVREAIFAVHAETLHRSRISMRTRERLIHQYVRERFDQQVAVPCYNTLRAVWAEWFGPGGARQRYARSAAAVATSREHVVVHRPGQVVALDTTVLPVKVREHVFGEPVSAHLTLALDVYTRSIVAFRLTLISDTSVDVAMLLRDVMLPLPLREGWGEDMEWPYPGVPAAVVAEFAGHRVAALPFFAPETVTTDHGAVYKNHHLVEVQRIIGANILPARVLRPTDKQAVERTFGAIQSLLFEHLLGYQGVDVADRGRDPEADATLTIAEMEHLIATWVVRVWQNRRLGEHAPSWDPAGGHSPNTLFAAAMAQGGFALQIPAPELYYQLLPAHHVKIAGNRGVKVGGLWYDGPGLDPYRDQPSARGGRHKRKWVVRRDRRDPRFVYFQDPATHQWHTLRWRGLPPDGDVPSFGDASVQQLLRQVADAGLAPRSDAELLPVLLDIIAARTPVEQWPTQLAKRRRTGRAREATQTATVARDRPQPDAGVTGEASAAAVLPLRRQEHARQVQDAVDAERRRRREQAVPVAPPPPPRLGETSRRRSLLVLADDDAEDPPTQGPQ